MLGFEEFVTTEKTSEDGVDDILILEKLCAQAA